MGIPVDISLEALVVEDPKKRAALTLDEAVPRLEAELGAALKDGFLSDVVECRISDVATPEAVTPWSAFDYKLYRSAAATAAIRSVLKCTAAGTSDTFEDILSAVACGSPASGKIQKNHCYLVGGQVRDVLRGQLSNDIDFNYSCSAKEVALVTVSRGWPTKFKCIGKDVSSPNYVLVGDESSESYLEGFCIQFNATKTPCMADFTMNTLVYDLANDVIIDKCGGVSDIRAGALRLSLAAGETHEAWAVENFTPGVKELRYIKFLLRAEAKGKPLTCDPAESAFVVQSLRKALETNSDGLGAFFFGYTLKEHLQDSKGVGALRAWVDKNGGPAWWDERWEPLVRKSAAPGALQECADKKDGKRPQEVEGLVASLPSEKRQRTM